MEDHPQLNGTQVGDRTPRRRKAPAGLLDHPHIRTLVASQLGIRVQELRSSPMFNGDGQNQSAARQAEVDLANLLTDVVEELRAGG